MRVQQFVPRDVPGRVPGSCQCVVATSVGLDREFNRWPKTTKKLPGQEGGLNRRHAPF